jgi:aspartate-semialdehyde dehydrogenase
VTRGRRVVAVVGATGLVGSEIARLLVKRRFPLTDLLLFSSGRSPEREAAAGGRRVPIRPYRLQDLAGCAICFLAAGGSFSRREARRIAGLGCVVIDNSSALRMEDDVPLVVPEVNPEATFTHRGVIANPNCSTIQMVVVLEPLSKRWGLRKVIVATYQSVTGAGLKAAAELAAGTEAVLAGGRGEPGVFPHGIGFNLIPQIDRFEPGGWTREELKMTNETRKIMGDPSIQVAATAVRVPVFRGHSEAVYAEFDRPVDPDEARRLLSAAPGVVVEDDPASQRYPMPADCAGRGETFVGRLRGVPGSPEALCMWIVSDNVLKGAALNAVQIAEQLVQ